MAFIIFLFLFIFSSIIKAQYYSPPMTGSGCVATGNKLYSHGNYIRELNSKELTEMEIYKHKLLEWKQQVDEAYARLEQAVQRNSTVIPTIPPRPQLPSFCTSNNTTLYILAGCTVQNNKVYIAGKYARDLNDKEKAQLEEFSKQMLAQQQTQKMENKNSSFGQNIQETSQSLFQAADSIGVTPPPQSSFSSTTSTPLSTTTISIPLNADIGRQIALDFCMEF